MAIDSNNGVALGCIFCAGGYGLSAGSSTQNIDLRQSPFAHRVASLNEFASGGTEWRSKPTATRIGSQFQPLRLIVISNWRLLVATAYTH
jgi:hypothetical protein